MKIIKGPALFLYRHVAEQLHARARQRAPDPQARWEPTIGNSVIGMKFIDAVVESSRDSGRWMGARVPTQSPA